MQRKNMQRNNSFRYNIQNYNMQPNPRKKYKRLRLKWFFVFLAVGIFIIWSGISGKRQQQPEQVPGDKEQEQIRDDFQYLEESPDIRVVLQAGEYDGIYHSKVEVILPEGGYVLIGENNQWEKHVVSKGKRVSVGIGDEFDFSITQDMLIAIVPADEEAQLVVTSIERNRAVCSYYGRLEVTLEDAGLLAVNALPLEKYLCSVVPSEMPASYATEALRAQAILARTYAYKYLIEPAYPEFGAHVDDSITFQVYGNIDNSATTSAAVADTAGVLLFSDRSLAEVYYYSTSCGYGTDGTAWGGEGKPYLKGLRIGPGVLQNADGTLSGEAAEQYYLEALREEQTFRNMITQPFVEGYEAQEIWYRWSANDVEIQPQEILSRLQERYAANPNVILTKNKKGEWVSKAVKDIGKIKSVNIEERGVAGIAQSMIIEGTECTYKVLLEYNIRYVLNGAGTTVIRADGTAAYCSTLLPSGFFYLDTVQDGQNVISYNIYGGGYGHGVGMSQNGANQMAGLGFSCEEILQKFFPKTIFVSYKSE